MKSIKFAHKLVQSILDGTKTTTWRLFDEKDLQVCDELTFVDVDSKQKFATAIIIDVREKKINELTDEDLKSNSYENREQVVTVNLKYYGDRVTEETLIKMIAFKLI